MNRDAAKLLSEKVMREIFRIGQAYGKELPNKFEDLVHDLGVMLVHDALQQVSLKFYRPGERREVLVAYEYALHAGNPQFHLDDAQGLGIVPLAPPVEMSLIVYRDSQNGRYERELLMNWGAAPQFTQRGGFVHQDGNTSSRTGGRASKQVYMGDALRRSGTVKFFLPNKHYGFITGQDGGSQGCDIFFHEKNAQGFAPRAGQHVTYLTLATPRGIQAKDIRAAG
jgi:cold shock CspA family protein